MMEHIKQIRSDQNCSLVSVLQPIVPRKKSIFKKLRFCFRPIRDRGLVSVCGKYITEGSTGCATTTLDSGNRGVCAPRAGCPPVDFHQGEITVWRRKPFSLSLLLASIRHVFSSRTACYSEQELVFKWMSVWLFWSRCSQTHSYHQTWREIGIGSDRLLSIITEIMCFPLNLNDTLV